MALWPLAALLIALAVAGTLAHRLQVPPAMGYLLAGIAAGTFVADATHALAEPLEFAGEMGVLLLLFLIGLELDLERLRRTLRASAAVMPFDVLVPFAIVGGGARLLGWSVNEALALGMTVALSSTILGEKLTSSHVRPKTRQRVIGVLISEDVAAGALLAFMALLGGAVATAGAGDATGGAGTSVLATIGRMGFLLILVAAGALLVIPRALDMAARSHVHELVVLTTAGLMVLFGALGAWAGSSELGAFLAGVAAAEAGSRFVARSALQGLRDTAVALFFFVSGSSIHAGELIASPGPALLVAGLFLGSKLLVHLPASAAAGLSWTEALRTAFALGTLGEFSLVLAAVATRQGLAHPDLQPAIVGAMLILLPIAATGVRKAPRLVALRKRIPERVRQPIGWLVRALQRIEPRPEEQPGQRRGHLRRLASNLIIMTALGLLAAWAAPQARDLAPDRAVAAQAGVWGAAFALSIPLLRGAYKGYRDLVWSIVGLRPGERVGAGMVRARIVDTAVAISAVLALSIVSLSVPATLPVLLAGAIIAAGIAALAWRRLSDFHQTIEETVSRVLGSPDAKQAQLLNEVLSKYPWGVRMTAVVVPPSSPAARRTIEASRIGPLTGASVAVIQRRGKEIVSPGRDETLWPGDTLILLGDAHQLARAEALVVAHGEAIHMAAQSRDAALLEVEVPAGSQWVGQTLHDLDVRGSTGALVAGVWSTGAAHPRPYDARRTVTEGDRILVLGSALQHERVRLAIAPPPVSEESGADDDSIKPGAGS